MGKALVEELEAIAAELEAKGAGIRWRLQQTLEMTPTKYSEMLGQADGYRAAAAHILERVATYKAIQVGDTVVMLAGPMPGKTAVVSHIIEGSGICSLEVKQDGKTVAWGGAHFHELRKVL